MECRADVESAADGSSDELVAQFDAAYTFLGSYLPDELQADLTLVRASFASYMQALSGVDLSNPDALTDEQTAALDAASASVDNPEVAGGQHAHRGLLHPDLSRCELRRAGPEHERHHAELTVGSTSHKLLPRTGP